MAIRWLMMWAIVLTIAGGCQKTSSENKGASGNAPPTPPPPSVKVHVVTRSDVIELREFTGRTAAAEHVEIRARVSGTLLQSPGRTEIVSSKIAAGSDPNFVVTAREGEPVLIDTPLFEIDPAPYRALLDQARGNLAAKQSQIARLDAELQRAEQLRKTNSISEADYDLAFSNRAEVRGQIETLEAQIRRAELDLGFTKVVAPINGVLGRTLVTPGNLVTPDSTLLATIVSVDPIHVYFEVDENSLLEYRDKVRRGELDDPQSQKVQVGLGLGNEAGFPHQGMIDFIEPVNDSRTGTTVLRGTFQNKDGLLNPGLFARVQIRFSRPYAAIVVPTTALAMDQAGRYVFVVSSENQVERRTVKVRSIQGEIAIIAEGIAEGERVISAGLQKVRDKAKVNIENDPANETSLPAAPAANTPGKSEVKS